MRAFFLSNNLIVLLVLFLLSGCDILGSRSTYVFTIIPDEVSVHEKTDHSITFRFKNTCSSGCWKNIRPVIQKNGTLYKIRMVAEMSNNFCLHVCGVLEKEIKINAGNSGNLTFQFVHRDSIHQEFSYSFP